MEFQQLTRLQETLRASLQVAKEFSDLLEAEKKQLTSTQRDAVNALLLQKEELIVKLTGHQKSILSFCETSNIEPSYGALRSFLYRLGVDNAEDILSDWTALKNTLIKNQALNKTNEAILVELMRRNKIKQSIIHNLGRNSDTYSSQGQQRNQTAQGWVEQV